MAKIDKIESKEKVSVKVEKDNIKIRVGGGYLSIDEFLD